MPEPLTVSDVFNNRFTEYNLYDGQLIIRLRGAAPFTRQKLYFCWTPTPWLRVYDSTTYSELKETQM